MGTVVKLAAARQHMKAAPATIDPAVTLWLHKALADGKEYAAIIVERVALRDAAIPAEAGDYPYIAVDRHHIYVAALVVHVAAHQIDAAGRARYHDLVVAKSN